MKRLSLKLRFIIYFSIAIVITWGIATSITYFLSQKILKEVFDSQQVLFAKRLASLDITIFQVDDDEIADIKSKAIKRFDYDDDVLSFAVFNSQGEMVFHDDEDGEDFKFNGTVFQQHDPVYMQDTKKWRIIWLRTQDNSAVIAVGQENDYREEMAEKMAISQAYPWLVMLTLLMLLIIFTISRELTPLNKLAKQLKQRQPDDASLIVDNNAPKEIKPFIDALNALFIKITDMIIKERQFTANAAHELRTPLTALRVQAEVAQIATINPTQQKKALNNLILGIDRASRLIEQLLVLSRLDAENKLLECEILDWEMLIQSEFDLLSPVATQKQIVLDYQQINKHSPSQGNSVFISLLLRNLIDNAIKYCPNGSKITVIEHTNRLSIEDTGQGVDKETLAKLGERFYRPAGMDVPGSGLGISIVKQIANLHRWRIQFYINPQGGLGVNIFTSLTT